MLYGSRSVLFLLLSGCLIRLSQGQNAPFSPPSAFTVTVLSTRSVRLSWRAPPVADWNDGTLDYFMYCVVQRTVSNTFSSCSNSPPINASDDPNFHYSEDVTDLQPLGQYYFSMSVRNQFGFSPFTQELSVTLPGHETRLFELALTSNFECQRWITTNANISSLYSELIYYIRSNCNCNFIGNGGSIDLSEVSCRAAYWNKVVVRARVIAPTGIRAADIIDLIDDWKDRTKSIVIGGQRLDFDLSCPTRIDTFLGPECQDSSYSIAGGVILALFILACLFACVLLAVGIVTIRYRFRRRKSYSYRKMRAQGSKKQTYIAPFSQPELMDPMEGATEPVATTDTKKYTLPEAGWEGEEGGIEQQSQGTSQHEGRHSPSLPNVTVETSPPATLEPVELTTLKASETGSRTYPTTPESASFRATPTGPIRQLATPTGSATLHPTPTGSATRLASPFGSSQLASDV